MNQEDARVVAEAAGIDQFWTCGADSVCHQCVRTCPVCGNRAPNFTSRNYLRLIEWAREQEWWDAQYNDFNCKAAFVETFQGFCNKYDRGAMRKLEIADFVYWAVSSIAQAIRQHKEQGNVD